ncbi:hypothetical protein CTheo_8157 [Ceratobasidium theobromae]|uniref:ABM domain-containing protein n=1 Tax=Ceratobasidium theobromae TaxID=1582974 RepID=A0A5N5Q9J7_9AGAM|nr:hypothetical protein CTheo_8157 [Ceratobasidium theobromae]
MSSRYIVYITLTPKTPDLLENVRRVMLDTRDMFLRMEGSISHDVGVADGKVHVIETWVADDSGADAERFEKTPEHDVMIQSLLPLVTSDIVVVKLESVGASRDSGRSSCV